MAEQEFAIIARYFSSLGRARDDVIHGVGDDAAVLAPPPGQDVVTAAAVAVAGQDYALEDPAAGVGHRLLARALSGLAEQGAEPAWATLSVALRSPEPAWLEAFSQGLGELAAQTGVRLVGGDTTAGADTLVLHALGFLPRDIESAQAPGPGDHVYVTDTLGDAGLALLARQGELRLTGPVLRQVEGRLERPPPQVRAGLAARGLISGARACWEGLSAALDALLGSRGLGATVHAELLPISAALADHLELAGGWTLPLRAGGEPALCLLVPDRNQARLETTCGDAGIRCAWVGSVESLRGLRCTGAAGEAL